MPLPNSISSPRSVTGRLLKSILTWMLVPIVPFVLFGWYFEPWIEDAVGALNRNPVAVAIVVPTLLCLDVLLPIPSSFLNTLSGQVLGLWIGGAACWFGMMAGTIVGYMCGRFAGLAFDSRQNFNDSTLKEQERWVVEQGTYLFLWTRPLPILAEAATLLLGRHRYPFRSILGWAAISYAFLGFGYAWLGSISQGERWQWIALGLSVVVPLALSLVIQRLDPKSRQFADRPLNTNQSLSNSQNVD